MSEPRSENLPLDNPWRNPAYGVEMTERERKALMTETDWSEVVDRILSEGVTNK